MRTFVAIELPDGLRRSLSRIQIQLKSSEADVKWVAPENIHLTLKFLGEIDEKTCERINQALQEIANVTPPFTVRVSSIGAFPKAHSPRVIWVGIDKGDGQVKEIAKTLEEAIAKIGIPKETRPFSTHITIGRVRSSRNQAKLAIALNALAESGLCLEELEFPVTKIAFFKSTLTPRGPIYEILKEAALKTT